MTEPIDYLTYWSLRSDPFRPTEDPCDLFLGSSHRVALSAITDSIADGDTRILVVGRRGCGASTLLQYLAQMRGLNGWAIHASYLPRETQFQNLIERLSRSLGVPHSRIGPAIKQLRISGICPLLMTDHVSLSFLATVQRRLIDLPEITWVASIPSAQRSWAKTLHGRSTTTANIEPLSQDETCAYVDWAMKRVGRISPIFSPDAKSALHRASDGVLADANQIATISMRLAANRKHDGVSSTTVYEAAAQWVAQNPTRRPAHCPSDDVSSGGESKRQSA